MSASDVPLSIVHFNDVYHVNERSREPVGGCARFTSAVREYSTEKTLVLFSGDVFAPSLDSTITKGKHMVPILNGLNIRASCFGNHDFDFGSEQLRRLIARTNFPWVCTNAADPETGLPLLGVERKVVIDWEDGQRVGVMGLLEYAWLETLSTLDAKDVVYTDFLEAARSVGRELREEDGCTLVVALTHMREPNDLRLAAEVEEVDMVLGGHDHFWRTHVTGPDHTLVCKSGTDFREFSFITLDVGALGTPGFASVEHVEITSAFPPTEECLRVTEECNALVGEKMNKVIGHTSVALDATSAHVRTRETNLGDLITDIVRLAFDCDIVLLNSGTIRSNDVYGPGPISVRDITNILPMEDMMVVIECTGAQVLEALENGVCKYPAHEGRFPQVSGIRFTFDPEAEPGSRIVDVWVGPDMHPIDLDRTYTLSTKEYIAGGKDGYDVFADCKVLVDGEEGIMLPIAIRNHFTMLMVVQAFQHVETCFDRAIKHFSKSLRRIRERRASLALANGLLLPPTSSATSSSDSITSSASQGPSEDDGGAGESHAESASVSISVSESNGNGNGYASGAASASNGLSPRGRSPSGLQYGTPPGTGLHSTSASSIGSCTDLDTSIYPTCDGRIRAILVEVSNESGDRDSDSDEGVFEMSD